MTTHKIFKTPTGDTVEIRTNVGATPRVFVNGAIQSADKADAYMYLLNHQRWYPTTLWIPRKINGRWYWPGARVYRRYSLSPGGGMWTYGDEFDMLKEIV